MPRPLSSHGTHPWSFMARPNRLILLGMLGALVWLRIYNPTLLPMYYDEALHIERAQRVLSDRTLVMGTEGGKYLQIWILALLLPLTDDPLLVARILSALIGLVAGIGCYLLANHLYRRTDVALVALAFAAFVPHLVFFDRLAMSDGLLSALAVWILLLSLIAVRQARWWPDLALGMCLGMAAATKLTGLIFLVFPLLAAWLWRGGQPWRRVLPRLAIAWLVAVPWLLPTFFDFSSQAHSTMERSWLNPNAQPYPQLAHLAYNSSSIAVTLWHYMTPPITLLALVVAGRVLRRRDNASALLTLAALVPLAFFFSTAGAHKFHPRYILPAFPFLLIMAAHALVTLADWLSRHLPSSSPPLRHGLLVILALLVSLPGLRFDYFLLTDPSRLPLLPRDRQVFIDGPLSGYGVVDAAQYLHLQANEMGRIIVVKRTDNKKRTGAWGYYLDQPNILLEAINLKYTDSQELLDALTNAPASVFAVLDRPSEDRYATDFTEGPYAPYSTLVATFPRPGGLSRIEIYRLVPNP